jgi:hypothetical protein
MGIHRRIPVDDREVARHAQVDNERFALIERKEKVFAAPPDCLDGATGNALL